MDDSGAIHRVGDLLDYIRRDTASWGYRSRAGRPWFRGQRDVADAPLPSLFRHPYDEHGMTNMFRNRAAVYGSVPDRTGHTDEWLFLMQHHGAPTRLLDWTESALVGLFFAVFRASRDHPESPEDRTDAGLWMLHPLELNALEDSIGRDEFPNTWANIDGNTVRNNIDRAFWTAGIPSRFPIAVQTTFSRGIMSSQKSCFTVHGSLEQDFESLLSGTRLQRQGYFRKYIIPAGSRDAVEKELDVLGVTNSVVFPDLGGLALELKHRFRTDL
jgi:hypothetical protein